MKERTKKIILFVLALIGLGLTIKLAFIYYSANYDRYALSSFCSINNFIDCDGAARTTYSQFFGIPLAYWGMFFYLLTLFLIIVDKLKQIKFLKFLEVFKNPFSYITVLGTLAFFFSMVMAGISLFVIKKVCLLCVITYLLDFIITLFALDLDFKNFVPDLKNTYLDFIEGAQKYKKTFIILSLSFITFIAYSGISLNFVPNIKYTRSITKYMDMKHNPYRIKGNVLGNPDGDIIMEVYSDYVCPMCYGYNIMLHKAIKKYKNIKVVHHNYPLDKTCNPNISVNMHPGACYMWRAAIAARNQGNYWGMGTLLYEHQPRNNDDMAKLVKKLKLDENKFFNDMEAEETYKEITAELQYATEHGINATPSAVINGKIHVGIEPYEKFEKYLINNGAKTK